MYTKDDLQKTKQVLESAENIAILIHKNPDPDALGSASAMYQSLRKLGKQASVFSPSIPPDVFSFVPLFEQIQTFTGNVITNAENFDTYLFLDGGELHRFVSHGDFQIPEGVTVVNFDHHPDNQLSAEVELLSDEMSSTAEIVYDFLKSANWKITEEIAKALMIGIIGDTGWLKYSLTTPETFRKFAELLEINDCLVELDYYFSHGNKVRIIPFWQELMNSLQVDENVGMISTYVERTRLKGLGLEESEISLGYHVFLDKVMRGFEEIDLSLVLLEKEDGRIHGSMRSELGTIDVGKVCAQFEEGGGHLNAAGFATKKSQDEIMEIVRDGVEKFRV